MMAKDLVKNEQGFSLAELLVVLAMTGVVVTAMLSLYMNTQRTAVTSEEVVEVQQNLRIATEMISKDVRMAGFMVSKVPTATNSDTNAFSVATNATSLILRTASAVGIAARLGADVDVTGGVSAVVLASPTMVDLFANGDVVRIIRTPIQEEPLPGTLNVTGSNVATSQITLNGFSAPVTLKKGDIVVRTTATAPLVSTISYCLGPAAGCGQTVTTCPVGQICLMRVVNGSADVIASNMAPDGLQFGYLLKGGTETTTPTASQLDDIKAVRVTITGRTTSTVNFTQGVPKVRSIASVISLRNR